MECIAAKCTIILCRRFQIAFSISMIFLDSNFGNNKTLHGFLYGMPSPFSAVMFVGSLNQNWIHWQQTHFTIIQFGCHKGHALKDAKQVRIPNLEVSSLRAFCQLIAIEYWWDLHAMLKTKLHDLFLALYFRGTSQYMKVHHRDLEQPWRDKRCIRCLNLSLYFSHIWIII